MYKYILVGVCCLSLHASEDNMVSTNVPGKNIEAIPFFPSQYLVKQVCTLDILTEVKKRLEVLPGNKNTFSEKFVTNQVNAQAAFDDKGMSYMALIDVQLDSLIKESVKIDDSIYQIKRSSRNKQRLVEFYRKEF